MDEKKLSINVFTVFKGCLFSFVSLKSLNFITYRLRELSLPVYEEVKHEGHSLTDIKLIQTPQKIKDLMINKIKSW